MFDPEAKERRHREVFPEELKKAFALGGKIASAKL
jgi:hypothetical protein